MINSDRTIIVARSFPPISGPGVWRMLSLTSHLAERGHDVVVIAADRPGWIDVRDETLLQRVPGSVRVHRPGALRLSEIDEWLSRLSEGRALRPLRPLLRGLRWRLNCRYPDPEIIWGTKAAILAAMEAMRRSPSCVISSGPPHIAHLAGLVASRVTGCAWIMDYRDLWTDDPGQVAGGQSQQAFAHRLEAVCLRSSSAVVTVSEQWKHALEQRAERLARRRQVHVVRNGFDPTFLGAMPSGQTTGSPFRILHAGTVQLNSVAALLNLMEALAIVRRQVAPESMPQVICTGLGPKLSARVADLGLTDIVSDVGFRPHGEVAALTSESAVVLVSVGADKLSYVGTVPAKTYEAMALGKFVFGVVPGNGDCRRLLEQYGHALLCESGSMDSIVGGLLQLIEWWRNDQGQFSSSPSAAEFGAQYSRRRLSMDYECIIRQQTAGL